MVLLDRIEDGIKFLVVGGIEHYHVVHAEHRRPADRRSTFSRKVVKKQVAPSRIRDSM